MGCGKTSVGRALQRLAAAEQQASVETQASGAAGAWPATDSTHPAGGEGAWLAGSSPSRLTPPSADVDGPPATEPRVLRPGQPDTTPAGKPIRFADLDEEIVRREGRSVQEIFRTRGEATFRAAEYEALADLIGSYSGDETLLIALGGGTLMRPASRELVRACCHCIYLRASVQTLAAHLSGAGAGGSTPEVAARPLLAGPGTLEEKIARILADRTAVYESTARHIIDTDGRTISDLATAILPFL